MRGFKSSWARHISLVGWDKGFPPRALGRGVGIIHCLVDVEVSPREICVHRLGSARVKTGRRARRPSEDRLGAQSPCSKVKVVPPVVPAGTGGASPEAGLACTQGRLRATDDVKLR